MIVQIVNRRGSNSFFSLGTRTLLVKARSRMRLLCSREEYAIIQGQPGLSHEVLVDEPSSAAASVAGLRSEDRALLSQALGVKSEFEAMQSLIRLQQKKLGVLEQRLSALERQPASSGRHAQSSQLNVAADPKEARRALFEKVVKKNLTLRLRSASASDEPSDS